VLNRSEIPRKAALVRSAASALDESSNNDEAGRSGVLLAIFEIALQAGNQARQPVARHYAGRGDVCAADQEPLRTSLPAVIISTHLSELAMRAPGFAGVTQVIRADKTTV
jgi:hypothetical protein